MKDNAAVNVITSLITAAIPATLLGSRGVDRWMKLAYGNNDPMDDDFFSGIFWWVSQGDFEKFADVFNAHDPEHPAEIRVDILAIPSGRKIRTGSIRLDVALRGVGWPGTVVIHQNTDNSARAHVVTKRFGSYRLVIDNPNITAFCQGASYTVWVPRIRVSPSHRVSIVE